MANPEHLEILKQGTEAWNKWRRRNPTVTPDLINAALIRHSLIGVNLENADLRQAILNGANL
jgi:hypothetical protein